MAEARGPVEWPTLLLTLACYAGWALATTWVAALWLPLGVGLTMLCIALHSSLCHEMLHGHPFRSRALNAALVFPALGLFVPYLRFRDTHLAHHRDSRLTDPYDDPESNYMDPAVWARLPRRVRRLLQFNNTLAGRVLVGPLIGQVAFILGDWRAIRAGDMQVLRGWLWHVPAVVPVLAWAVWAPIPVWAYLLAAYGAMSILKIRTFLEHRAHETAAGRTVVIEDRGLLAFLFLNNNLHAVHHLHPRVAWYDLPGLFARHRDSFLDLNDGYHFRSYGEIFRRYFRRAKDPVPHPLWPGPGKDG